MIQNLLGLSKILKIIFLVKKLDPKPCVLDIFSIKMVP